MMLDVGPFTKGLEVISLQYLLLQQIHLSYIVK